MKMRITDLRRLMAEQKLEAFIFSRPENIRWLSGFTGSNGLVVVTKRSAWFFTDFRYQEQSRVEVCGNARSAFPKSRVKVLHRSLIEDFPVRILSGRVGVEKDFVSIGDFELLRHRVRTVGARLAPAPDLALSLRRTKDDSEVRTIAAAQRHTDRVFKEVLSLVRPGIQEKELAAEIIYRFSKVGETAFPPIVASGPNSALPHARPSSRVLRRGDAVTFDIGCRLNGYCSDMTRTVFVGPPDPDLAQVYHIVHEAQRRALEAVRPGAACADVDLAGRNFITDAGYGEQFGHSLGHGVGLEVHEEPGLHRRSIAHLEPGDVVTIEPGIYLPGLGGVRIEDMVVVTKTGCRNLTRSPKKLLVIGD